MITRIRKFVAGIYTDSDDDDSVFAGTVLDWSMDYAHGGQSHAEAAREIEQLQENADTLEAQHRENRK